MSQGWEAPDGSRTVVFARGIAAALRARTLEAFHSVPKRGAEIGGLLFGRVLRTKPLLARITGFEEIPCQYRFGPSYVLSGEDLPQLDAALRKERTDPILGFFRSYTGREMLLDEADRNLLSRYFPDERFFFLLLQPKSSEVCSATFLFPENGEIGWEPQYPSIEFNEARLTGQASEPANQARAAEPVAAASPASPARHALTSRILSEAAAGVAAEAPPEQRMPHPVAHAALADPEAAVREPPPALEEPLAQPEAEPVDAMAACEPLPAPRLLPLSARAGGGGDAEPRRKRAFFLPLLGWIVLCIAAAGVYELWTMARAPRWTPLGLSAQVAPGAIHLSWNSALRPVRDAARGTLSITDGSADNRVALTPDQIHGGQYEYHPTARNVLFRLELSGAGLQAAGDSLQVISPAPVAAAQTAKPAPPHPAESSADRGVEQERQGDEPRPANVAVLPEPLREIHPDIPPGIRARIHDRVVVPVEVKVTAGGRVTSAAAHGSGDSLYHYLADRATKAARGWRFSPARARNGRAVPATRTVYFIFRPVG